MAVAVTYSSFDLHAAGKSASNSARDSVVADNRGSTNAGVKTFTDGNRDFTAEGIDNTWRLEVLEGTDAVDIDVVSVSADTITTGSVGNFTGSDGVLYRLYKPPTSAQIISDADKRGVGLAGYVELLNAIDASLTGTLLTQGIDISYSEGNVQQMITYDDA